MMDKAERHNEGKPELDYILEFPKTLICIANVMSQGATKYSVDNWKKGGKPNSEYYSACLRHLLRARKEEVDKESGQYHIAHAIWNLMAMMELNIVDRTKEESL